MRHFSNIQAMRGVASLMVCLVHSVALPVSVGMEHVVPLWAAVGPAGVDLFFVISGFIIATVANEAGAKAQSRGALNIAREFAFKRAARIYPLYWIVFTIAILAAPYVWLAPDSIPKRPLWQLFFLVSPSNYKIMAAWTLVYEMYFYLIMTFILILSPRNIFKGLLVWSTLTIAAIGYFAYIREPRDFDVMFSPLLIEFMLGTVVAYLVKRGVRAHPIGAISVGVLWFAIGAYENSLPGYWLPWVRVLCFGPSGALIVYGVIAAEVQTGWTFSRAWQRLGDASYSLYIWHQLLFFSMLTISQKLGLFTILPGWTIVPAWIVIVIAWALVSFTFVEDPLRKKLESIVINRRASMMPTISPSPAWLRLAWNPLFFAAIFVLPTAAVVTSGAEQAPAVTLCRSKCRATGKRASECVRHMASRRGAGATCVQRRADGV